MQNTNKKLLIGVGIILLIIVLWVFISKGSSSPSNTNINQATSTTVVPASTQTSTHAATPATAKITEGTTSGICNFVVTFPKANQAVTFPLTIIGYIDQAKSTGCLWNENLSRAGTVEVSYDVNGAGWQVPGVPVPIIANGSLGTAQSTSTLAFTAPVNLQTAVLGLRSGTPVKFTFTELNVTNVPNPDTFSEIVYLK